MLYATDASIYQVEPLGVVIPRSTAEALEVINWCGQRGLALLPRGAGTSLAGQAVGPAVIVDFSAHCGQVLAIDPERRTALVEPGLVLDELNRVAAGHGLMFGPDVATSTHATLGGMIGNNSAGAHSVLYGRTVEHTGRCSSSNPAPPSVTSRSPGSRAALPRLPGSSPLRSAGAIRGSPGVSTATTST
jgi:FAD/FMN-containing dehydrogenase